MSLVSRLPTRSVLLPTAEVAIGDPYPLYAAGYILYAIGDY